MVQTRATPQTPQKRTQEYVFNEEPDILDWYEGQRKCWKCMVKLTKTPLTIMINGSNDSSYEYSLQLKCHSCRTLNHACPECPHTDRISRLVTHFQSQHEEPNNPSNRVKCPHCSRDPNSNKKLVAIERKSLYLHEIEKHYSQINKSMKTMTWNDFSEELETNVDAPSPTRFDSVDETNSYFTVFQERAPSFTNSEKVKESIKTAQEDTSLPKFAPPKKFTPEEIEKKYSYTYRTRLWVIDKLVKSKMTQQQIKDEIELEKILFPNGPRAAPKSYEECLLILDSFPPCVTYKKSEGLSQASIRDFITFVLNDPYFCQELHLEGESSDNIVESYQTKHFLDVDRKRKNSCTLQLIVYIDAFRKFNKTAGDCMGVYFSLLNFSRAARSRMSFIFPLALYDPRKVHLFDVLAPIVEEINSLENNFVAYHCLLETNMTFNCHLSLLSCDTPQRSKILSFQGHGADIFCTYCPISKDDMMDKQLEDTRYDLKIILEKVKEYSRLTTITDRKEYIKRHGIKPVLDEDLKTLEPSWNPLWDLSSSDPYKITPVDYFHVDILGLLKSHLDLLLARITDLSKVNDILRDMTVNGSTPKDIKDFNSWGGDDILEFMIVAPFILSPYVPNNLYKTFVLHAQFTSLMLSGSMNQAKLQSIKSKLKILKEALIEVYGEVSWDSKPNWHNIEHCIEHIELFGPPTLWWTRPFETRHNSCKEIIRKNDNKKNTEHNLTNRLLRMETIRYYMPQEVIEKKKNVTFNVGEFIEFKYDGGIHLGKITNRRGKQFTVCRLKSLKQKVHALLQCGKVDDVEELDYVTIPKSDILYAHLITDGYFNPFGCLQYLKINRN